MDKQQLLKQLDTVITTDKIMQAFKKIDRKDFVPEPLKDQAYEDVPLAIGHNQTISQPTTVAIMLELLQPEGEILDIGAGSGYTTALLSTMGNTIGTEIIPELTRMGQHNIKKYNATIIHTDTLGIPEKKFDRILVNAAADKFPEELMDQLKQGGIMVIPVKNTLWKVTHEGKEVLEGFSFVPLQ